MARVTGIGGIFFKSPNVPRLSAGEAMRALIASNAAASPAWSTAAAAS